MKTVTTPIIPQPVFPTWFDARRAAADLARTHGYAVLVAAGGMRGFRVIPGADLETCTDLAGKCKVLADFNDCGVQS